ncbi:MAG: class I SAM-dependent methyltransferase family protein, partial [Candidatus Micrarchaeota archaeon]|nr:class I SAM-dependent methyltransferase family protein [Candidatus Micrarchaeota archaeon]
MKVKKSKAEKARQYLEGLALLSTKHRIYGANSFIYLPIVQNADDKIAKSAAKLFDGTIEKRDFEPAGEKGAYRQLLHQSLGAKYDDVTKSYDLIGNIAVIDAKGKAAKDIAKAVMSTNKNVETVISKGGAVSGKYRTRKYLHIMGKRNFVAHYKENGAEFKFDIRKTFFSSRLAYDRLRIAKLVGKNENVVVMFAGMGPFAIEIAKMHKDANVVGIELNRSAYSYMKQNISLNHLHNATAVLGDVGKVAHKYKGFADRIIMPLPRDAYRFLGAALEMSKRKSTIHYYAFGDRESAFEDKIGQVKTFFAKRHRKIRIASKRIARQYSA